MKGGEGWHTGYGAVQFKETCGPGTLHTKKMVVIRSNITREGVSACVKRMMGQMGTRKRDQRTPKRGDSNGVIGLSSEETGQARSALGEAGKIPMRANRERSKGSGVEKRTNDNAS